MIGILKIILLSLQSLWLSLIIVQQLNVNMRLFELMLYLNFGIYLVSISHGNFKLIT